MTCGRREVVFRFLIAGSLLIFLSGCGNSETEQATAPSPEAVAQVEATRTLLGTCIQSAGGSCAVQAATALLPLIGGEDEHGQLELIVGLLGSEGVQPELASSRAGGGGIAVDLQTRLLAKTGPDQAWRQLLRSVGEEATSAVSPQDAVVLRATQAAAFALVGDSQAGMDALQEASNLLVDVRGDYFLAAAHAEIAIAQARLSLMADGRDSVQQAGTYADEVAIPHSRANARAKIARAQAILGDVDRAREIAARIPEEIFRLQSAALRQVAHVAAEQGDHPLALEVADGIVDLDNRALAYGLISAEIALQREDPR